MSNDREKPSVFWNNHSRGMPRRVGFGDALNRNNLMFESSCRAYNEA